MREADQLLLQTFATATKDGGWVLRKDLTDVYAQFRTRSVGATLRSRTIQSECEFWEKEHDERLWSMLRDDGLIELKGFFDLSVLKHPKHRTSFNLTAQGCRHLAGLLALASKDAQPEVFLRATEYTMLGREDVLEMFLAPEEPKKKKRRSPSTKSPRVRGARK